MRNKLYSKYIKRILDIAFGFSALIILFPVILGIAVLVRIKLGSPVLFKQKRPGKNEKIFEIYKFRSMTDAKDKSGNLLSDEKRLTPFGKRLRASSLDELPELINILKGDMSIVGPRPQLVKDMVFMTVAQRKRHTVLPGLTGLAQINGRNNISWEEKLNLDLTYIKHISFYTDFKIVLKTIKKVWQKEGIVTQGMDTAMDLGEYMLKQKKVTKNEYAALCEKARHILDDNY